MLPFVPGVLVNAGNPDFWANAGKAMKLAKKKIILSSEYFLRLMHATIDVYWLDIVFLHTLV